MRVNGVLTETKTELCIYQHNYKRDSFLQNIRSLNNLPFLFVVCPQFSAAETIMTSVIDEFPKFFGGNKARQVMFRISVCLAAFILGIPMVAQGGSHLFNLVDESVLGFPLLFIGFFEYFVVIHLYGEFVVQGAWVGGGGQE